jgi:hypothetical protein
VKHTPGPWNAQPGVMGGEWTLRHGPTDEVICIRANQANAQLIAVAPELLHQLQAALHVLKDYVRRKNEYGDVGPLVTNFDYIDEIIAKATGGAK